MCIYHTLIDTILADQLVDIDLLELSDTMTSILSLFVVMWIIINVVDYNFISSNQIYTNTT